MRKKGESILTQNVPGLILAIAIIVLIVLGIWAGFNRLSSGQESENAKATLDNIEGKIENLEIGESGSFAIQGFKNSENWYLRGFNWEIDNPRPDRCFEDNCLCLCKGGSSVDDCNSRDSFCRFFEEEVYTETNKTDVIYVNGQLRLRDNRIEEVIQLRGNLLELIIEKTSGQIKLLVPHVEERIDRSVVENSKA